MRKFIPAFVLAMCSMAATFGFALYAPSSPGASVAVLFPPSTPLIDAVAAVAETGGRVERTGRWDNVVVASFPGREPPVDALQESGAWLVFNALIAGGCDPAANLPQTQAARTQIPQTNGPATDPAARDEGLSS